MLPYLGNPIVFLACVNSYTQGKRLRYLVQERKSLAQIIKRKSPFQYFTPVQKGNRSHQFFLDKLTSLGLHRKVQVLHLIGPTNPNGIFVESEDFETKLSMEEMGLIIKQLPHLKLVYLDGCATPELLDFFLKKDVPAVIGSNVYEQDNRSHLLAKTFYDKLSEGKSVLEAFWQTSQRYDNFSMIPVTYNIEKDRVECNSNKDNELPWGMYYFEENLPKIQELPRKRTLFPVSFSTKHKFRQYSRIGQALLATALGLLAVGVSIYLLNPLNFFLFLSIP
ncbi:MAG: hypothetical protein MRZ79_22065 [Bacteroidia bacterium]|nr:hypothetical protein [Bacteroidia bacterium]